MAGKKGRSGRKSWDKELDSKELWQLSTQVLKSALKSKTTPLSKKQEIALSLVTRMLPREVDKPEGEGVSFESIMVQLIKKSEGEIESVKGIRVTGAGEGVSRIKEFLAK